MNANVPTRTSQSSPLTRPTSSARRRAPPAAPARPGPPGRACSSRPSWSRSGEEVGEEAVCARDARGELAEEDQAGVDPAPLAVAGDERRAVERRLPRIGGAEERLVALVPLRREVDAALLDPAFEVGRTD